VRRQFSLFFDVAHHEPDKKSDFRLHDFYITQMLHRIVTIYVDTYLNTNLYREASETVIATLDSFNTCLTFSEYFLYFL